MRPRAMTHPSPRRRRRADVLREHPWIARKPNPATEGQGLALLRANRRALLEQGGRPTREQAIFLARAHARRALPARRPGRAARRPRRVARRGCARQRDGPGEPADDDLDEPPGPRRPTQYTDGLSGEDRA